jgi:hypothetical protein
MIESKIASITRLYRESQDATFDRGAMTESLEVNRKWVDFNYTMDMSPVNGLDSVYRFKIVLMWHDGKRLMSLSRESLLSKI